MFSKTEKVDDGFISTLPNRVMCGSKKGELYWPQYLLIKGCNWILSFSQGSNQTDHG
jgi:hypothetical protein